MGLDQARLDSGILDSDRPFVAFSTVTREDPKRTKEDGVMRFMDVDYATVTSPGGKSNTIFKADAFWKWADQEMQLGRCKPDWVGLWKSNYERYKAGQEVPVDGTPIRGWKLISGAQQEELIRFNILTVESLATLSDEGIRNIGMGAVDLKRRAKAWIAQNEGAEASAVKLTQVLRENEQLQGQLKTLTDQVEELKQLIPKKGKAA